MPNSPVKDVSHMFVRWAVCALIAAGGLAWVLAKLGPTVAIAG